MSEFKKGKIEKYFSEEAPEEILRAAFKKKIISKSLSSGRVSVSLVSNKELQKLKKDLLKKEAEVVDVLSFEAREGFPDPSSKKPFLGEVLLNKDIARKDPNRGIYLLVHGILHLFGYLHEKKGDIMKMETAEKEIMSTLSEFSKKRRQKSG